MIHNVISNSYIIYVLLCKRTICAEVHLHWISWTPIKCRRNFKHIKLCSEDCNWRIFSLWHEWFRSNHYPQPDWHLPRIQREWRNIRVGVGYQAYPYDTSDLDAMEINGIHVWFTISCPGGWPWVSSVFEPKNAPYVLAKSAHEEHREQKNSSHKKDREDAPMFVRTSYHNETNPSPPCKGPGAMTHSHMGVSILIGGSCGGLWICSRWFLAILLLPEGVGTPAVRSP